MKNDLRKLDQKSQEKLRLQAIKYIKNGSTHLEIAKFLGIKRQVISKWWSYYKLNGIQGLSNPSSSDRHDAGKSHEGGPV